MSPVGVEGEFFLREGPPKSEISIIDILAKSRF